LPVTKSAKKQMRVSERKRVRNQPVRSQCKTSITKAERLIFLGELEEAKKAVVAAISTLDKAAEKGVIHANNAARRKARLMKKLNEALSSSSVEKPAPASEVDEPE